MKSERFFDKQHFKFDLKLQGFTFDCARGNLKLIQMDNYKNALDKANLSPSTKCQFTVISPEECKATFEDESAISLRQFITRCKQDLKIEAMLSKVYDTYHVPKDIQFKISQYLPVITHGKVEKLIFEIILNTAEAHRTYHTNPACFICAPLDQLLMFKLLPNGEIGGAQVLNIAPFDRAIVLSESDNKHHSPEVLAGSRVGPSSDVWQIGNVIAKLLDENCLNRSSEFWNKLEKDCHIESKQDRINGSKLIKRVLSKFSHNALQEKDLENLSLKEVLNKCRDILYNNNNNAGEETAPKRKK